MTGRTPNFTLAPTAQQAGYRLTTFPSVGSTNAEALAAARDGDPGRHWMVSDHQQTGRGRRGRAWQTEPGNLAASLLIVDRQDLKATATLGFVAGLALHDALTALLPGFEISVALDGDAKRRFELKWPNDVLAGGAKLSGILLESTSLPDGSQATAIGWGVNVVSHPEGTEFPATSLAALSAGVGAADVFLALSDAWHENHALWNGAAGLDAIRRRWLERASGLGAPVAVRIDGRVVRGVFETIDADCRFVIREDEGGRLTHVAAGDVHFGAVASARAV